LGVCGGGEKGQLQSGSLKKGERNESREVFAEELP